ncbi:hypothetical protein GGD67_002646 [Bradyrhizobium sp. IAR9]|nr:hypothetical protein [Bradyrhizobium sp. IAR9]
MEILNLTKRDVRSIWRKQEWLYRRDNRLR